MPQNEILAPVAALDAQGQPRNFGWARSPRFLYDPDLVTAPRGLVTESDRYLLISPGSLMVVELLDSGCVGCVGMTVVSLRDRKRVTQTYRVPFSMGAFSLPRDSAAGSVRVQTRRCHVTFAAMEGGARIIKVDFPRFGHHLSLRGCLVLQPPPGAESLATHMPWRPKRLFDRGGDGGRDRAFRLAVRSPWYAVEGIVQMGGQEIVFSRGKAWGVLDWTRCVRPRQDSCFWAAGCGRSGGRLVGLSVGYDTADSSQGTGNAFFLDGKIHKLDQVTFHIPDRGQPWRFTSSDSRLEMTLTPNQEREERTQMFFHAMYRRQAFGSFRGRAILDNGQAVEFGNIAGFAERRKTRL